MKTIYLKIIFGCCTLLLLGCYPQQSASVNEYDIVFTNYAKDFDFPAHKSYALPDSVVLVTDASTSSSDPLFVDKATASVILTQIRTNLNNLGWVEEDTLTADIILLPTAFQTTNVSYYYPYYYWGWYYPGYYPGWGWGYPGYGYGYPVTSTYSTGTLMMQMTYRDGIEASSVPVVWTGLINGLLNTGGTSSSINNRIKSSIDQSFSQSPYLK